MTATHTDYHVPEWTIQDRLRKAREDAGLQPLELADRMEVSKATIYNYEGGATRHMKPYILKSWALATGVPADWLIDGTEPDTGPGGNDLANAPSICIGLAPVQRLAAA